MADSPADEDLADRYRRYLELCNDHELDRLHEVVAPQLTVNGVPLSRAAYAADIATLFTAFPDYRWELRHLVVNRPWVAAHLRDTATHTGAAFLDVATSGRRLEIQEMAVYAFRGGLISEVWSTSDRWDARRQLRGE